jgi:hypothetical protein
MLLPNIDDHHVVARLLDFFGSGTAWQRRLWDIGTILALDEALEAGQACSEGTLTEAALKYVCDSLIPLAGQDPGLGSRDDRKVVHLCLKEQIRPARHHRHLLEELLRQLRPEYLAGWAAALAGTDRPRPERTARAIASHLLDLGFSQRYLHRWVTYRVKNSTPMTLVDVVQEAHTLANGPIQQFDVLIAFGASPREDVPKPDGWLDAQAVSQWLVANKSDPRNVRQVGGILLVINARDRWGAATRAFEIADRLAARVAAGTRRQLALLDRVWVSGHPEAFPRERRGMEIGSLERDEKLYVLQPNNDLDAALELVAPLDSGGVSPAVAGAWAAIEALLVVPDDGSNRVIAAERLADLVACSFPRAELTTLAYKYMQAAGDTLKADLDALTSNRDRAKRLADHITAGGSLTLSHPSDVAAVSRMTLVLKAPKNVLADVQGHAARVFRRLYRQRNLVLHAGRVRAVALEATLRGSAPLIGAGLDRIAHAWFIESRTAAELAARAKVRLELVGTPRGRALVDLLEP